MRVSTTPSSAARVRRSIFDWPAKRGCTRCSRTVCARCSQGTQRSRKCWKQPARRRNEGTDEYPTSNIEHPTLNIQHPTANAQHPMSEALLHIGMTVQVGQASSLSCSAGLELPTFHYSVTLLLHHPRT